MHEVAHEGPELMTLFLKCIECDRERILKVPTAGFLDWRAGELIQRALPELSADDREQLISDICGECFDRICEETDDE